MDSTHWTQVSDLFERALELREEERGAFVERECGDDADLRKEVSELLAAAATENELPPVPTGILGAIPDDRDGDENDPVVSDSIPRHRLLRRIGQGGMGTVVLAEQVDPVSRIVAVKLLASGVASEEIVARFEAERHALARMDHPNIATVFDGGVSASGRPFFSMELVDGVPLSSYADAHRLSIEERVRLFLQVCGAVQHAHQKGVVHRDLKPNNILVAEVDGKPLVKVIDFGIAKAVAGTLGEIPFETVQGMFLGTPEYMSPEQMGLHASDVDTRADVYALGVVLYQLLVGVLPFPSGLPGEPPVALVQRIADAGEPVRPSLRLSGLSTPEAQSIVESRGEGRTTLRRLLRGDLDWIVLRAMERDRDRRYSTVAELAAELERFLRCEPVAAGPPSGLYRLRKWVERHRVAAGVAGFVLTTIVLFGAVMAIQAKRLARARDEAESSSLRAQSVARFLANVFTLADPGSTEGEEMTALEVLARGVERIDEDLAGEPRTRADLLETLADVHSRLGRFDDARTLQARGLAIRRNLAGRENEIALADALTRMGVIEARSMNFEPAVVLLEEGLEIRRRLLGDGSLEVADSLGALGRLALQRGEYEKALGLFRESLQRRRHLEEVPSKEQIAMLGNSGGMLVKLGRHSEARAPLEEALELVRQHYPADRRLVFGLQNSLVSVERETGRQEAVISLARSNVELGVEMYGERHPWVLTAYATLASELGRAGRHDEAIRSAEKALAGNRDAYGESSLPAIASAARLARILGMLGRSERCVGTADEILLQIETRLEQAPEDAPRLLLNRWEASQILGLCTTALGDLSQGEEQLRRSLGWAQKLSGEGTEVAETRFALGVNLLAQDRFDEAEPELLAGFEGLDDTPLESPEQVEALVDLYEEWGRPARADRYRELRTLAARGSASFH